MIHGSDAHYYAIKAREKRELDAIRAELRAMVEEEEQAERVSNGTECFECGTPMSDGKTGIRICQECWTNNYADDTY